MPYVSNMDLIVFIDSETNFIQGNSQEYELFLFKDLLDNPLNLNGPTAIRVAIWNSEEILLKYTSPFSSGTSGSLDLDLGNNTGKISFTITRDQSVNVTAGNLFAEVTVIYENFYPQPKTYVFEKIKIGQAIADETVTPPNGGGGGKSSASTVGPIFTLEHVDGASPSAAGRMSINDPIPVDSTKIIFKNLDKNLVRLTSLENILTRRISDDQINGIITLKDTGDSNLYAIYKIVSWQRLDLISGNGDDDDSDGIELTVVLESISTGPGVSKSQWEVGMELSYELDAHGITGSNVLPDGILTYVDKGLHPTITTDGDSSQTGVQITYSPYYDSYVTVEVNGISVELGNGTKDKDVYFSSNGGSTAVRIEEIRAGDELIWNGSIAGYELTLEDEVNLIYEADADQLR